MNRSAFAIAGTVAAVVAAGGAYGSISAAHARRRPMTGGTSFAQYRVDTTGVMARRLLAGPTVPSEESVAPDGKWMATVINPTGDIGIQDLSTGATRNLTHNETPWASWGFAPVVSPDGRRVAYGWDDEHDGFQVRTVDVDGGKPRVLRPGVYYDVPAAWSPDGKWILIRRARPDATNQIALLSTEDGSVRPLETLDWRAPSHMGFSADGHWVYYDFPPDSTHRDIYALAVDGSRKSTIVRSPGDDRLLGIAPGGKEMLFLTDRSGTPAAWLQSLDEGRVAGPPTLVKPDLWGAGPVGFTRDGSYVYFVDASEPTVYLAGLDPATGTFGHPTAIRTPGPGARSQPALSPDGRFLAYTLLSSGSISRSGVLVIRSLETGAVRELPPIPELGYLFEMHWTADSRSLLLLSTTRKNRRVMLRVDPQTGSAEQVTEMAASEAPTGFIALGGDSVLYAVMDQHGNSNATLVGRLAILHLDGGKERTLYTQQKGEGLGPANGESMSLSPSRSRVAFTTYLASGEQPALHILDLRTGVVHTVGATPPRMRAGSIAWLDESTLLVVTGLSDDSYDRRAGIVRIHLDSGRIEPTGIEMWGVGWLDITAARDRLAFVAGKASREIWEMSGFLADGNSDPAPRR